MIAVVFQCASLEKTVRKEFASSATVAEMKAAVIPMLHDEAAANPDDYKITFVTQGKPLPDDATFSTHRIEGLTVGVFIQRKE